MELKDQLSALQAEMKNYVEKATSEKTQYGTMHAETKSALEKLQAQVDAVDVKLATKHANTEGAKSLVDTLKENENVARILRDRKGSTSFTIKSSDLMQQKTVLTSAGVGSAVSGVLTIDRIPGIVTEARQTLRLRDLLVARPTTMQMVDFIKVISPLSPAQMVAETNLKPENAVTFGTQSEKVRTIATTLPATKQILDDATELAAYLQDSLKYAVDIVEESQTLAGDGTGENLHGLITQAQAYNTAATGSTDSRIDVIAHAISQIAVAKEFAPTFVVLNTADWWSMRLEKNSFGGYILGDPQVNVAPTLFGLTVVPTTSIAQGSFLVGSGVAPVAEIRDRQDTTVEISTEHADYFQRNMVLIRAEKRMALLVKRPGAFVSGSFGTTK